MIQMGECQNCGCETVMPSTSYSMPFLCWRCNRNPRQKPTPKRKQLCQQ